MRENSDIRRRAARTKLLLLDVDGVLTDGKIYLGPRGEEVKAFHVRDGSALVRCRRAGLTVALVSGRRSEAVAIRGRELGITDIYQGVEDKVRVMEELLERYSCRGEEMAYVGDDLADLPVMKKVGLSVAVADGHPTLRAAADYVTVSRGGEGAVMEVAELILRGAGR
jgi:3-deoxy-D-manno-octulosonate 8-phosphate phosphatase (KDO 8-P phosphatase)